MASGAEILRRIIAAQAGDGVGEDPAPAALDLALGRVTQAQFDTDGVLQSGQSAVTARDDLLTRAPVPALLMPLENDSGDCALMWFDPILVNAVVELMTAAPPRLVLLEPREPTDIDAALCREFAEGVLNDFVSTLAGAAGDDAPPGFSFLPHEIDIQKLKFRLGKGDYHLTFGRASFQEGVRGGDIAIALPRDLWQGRRAASGEAADRFSAQLASNVAGAPFRLRTELQVVSMPVMRAIGLRVGDIVPLSGSALSNVTLLSEDGVRLFHGRLGQKDGHKAVALRRGAAGIHLPALADPPVPREERPETAMPEPADAQEFQGTADAILQDSAQIPASIPDPELPEATPG